MNNWNESDWFKTWLSLARQGQNTTEQSHDISGETPANNRLAIKPVGSMESAPSAEMQVTE